MSRAILLFVFATFILGCTDPATKKAPDADTSQSATTSMQAPIGPYKDSSTNLIYNLLFCDNIELYKAHYKGAVSYPFDVLFAETSTIDALQKIVDDSLADPRAKLLAHNKMRALGHTPDKKELLAVIVELGFDNGTDVIASFRNGTGRYINQSGKLIIWETGDKTSNELTKDLFIKGDAIIQQIGIWEGPRPTPPLKGNTRITFLASDGVYFGEGPEGVLFSDTLAAPALKSATSLMMYMMEQTTREN